MQRILIDLTDIEKWRGNHGGIQRVVYGIAKNFYLQQDLTEQVRFISFSASNKRFYFTDFNCVYRHVEKLKSDDVKSELYPVVLQLKNWLNQYVPDAVKRSNIARKSSALITKKIGGPVVEPAKSETSLEWVHFNRKDKVLVLGKPWDNPDIQRILSDQRAKFNFKLVQVVYDLIICLYPHLHQPNWTEPYSQHMTEVMKHSDLLLPISKSSANDLRKFGELKNIKLPATKIIRLGDKINDRLQKTRLKPPSLKIDTKFIACIGTIEIRKNHMLLYIVYKLALEKGIELPQLVLVGSRGWLSSDFQHLIKNDPAIKDKIILLDSVDDSGLAWIYANCLFTTYPSMYEGWGLPIAESLAYGKLCVSSNTSSMPEVAGDLIDYFSPYNPEECLKKLALYLNKEQLQRKEEAIRNTYEQTDWEQTYDQILDVMRELDA